MSEAAPRIVIDNTIGALFIGTVIAMALWGMATVQLYYYFNQFPKDEWRLKVLVTVVWALDSAHQGMITHSTYVYLVTNYANPTFLLTITTSLSVMVEISGIICILVQIFLLYRVWRLSEKNIFLVAALFALVVAQFVTTTVYYSKGRNLDTTTLSSIAWLSKLVNSLSAGTDVTIAMTLIYLLHRSRTGFRRSETLINRLILFTVNTSFLTSICAVFSVIFVSVYPNALIYVAFYVNISKMYTNTLLATLNARKSTRDGFESSYNQGSSMILTRDRSEVPPRSANRTQNGRLAIRVETETMNNADNIVLGDMERNGDKIYDGSEHTTYSYDGKGLA